MPYSSDDAVVLGQRQLERTSAFMAHERDRFGDLPKIEVPQSRE